MGKYRLEDHPYTGLNGPAFRCVAASGIDRIALIAKPDPSLGAGQAER